MTTFDGKLTINNMVKYEFNKCSVTNKFAKTYKVTIEYIYYYMPILMLRHRGQMVVR